MFDDVRLAIEGRRPVEFYGRSGGNMPTAEEVLAVVRKLALRLPQNSGAQEVTRG